MQSESKLRSGQRYMRVSAMVGEVWAVYNSGDPLWNSDLYAIELVLFETKAEAMKYVRCMLEERLEIETSKLNDKAIQELMGNNEEDVYLHLYKLKVHRQWRRGKTLEVHVV